VRLAPIVAAALLAASLPAAAQVAPAPGEVAAYRGLHAAAHRGDAAEVARLAAADPGALQARDGNGRTPLHVATFARRADAIRALAKAGADLGALDAQRYDAVTIASVAADAPVDHVNRLHWTALIEAIVLGNGGPRHQACVRALLDAKADTSLGDRQGRSPLQLARDLRYREIAEMLQARGAR
jgi:ankyrin repeat protein